MVLTSRPIRVRMIRAMASNRMPMLLNHLLLCPTTISRMLPVKAIYGRPAIGLGVRRAITGYLGHGLRRRTKEHFGRRVIGAFGITATAFTAATGVDMLATMAASTTALAILASATRAAIGVAAISTTTARSTTSTRRMCTTFTNAMSAGIAGAALA